MKDSRRRLVVFQQSPSALAQVYPNLTDDELEEIDYRMRQYVAIAMRVATRVDNDPPRKPEASDHIAADGRPDSS